MGRRTRAWLPLLLSLAASAAAHAQVPRHAVDAAAGGGWFLDDGAIGHGTLGVAYRWHAGKRLSLGPEFVYWWGPGHDRDQTLTGNVRFDFRTTGTSPFVVAGGGLYRHTDRFFTERFSSTEGAFTLGGGVRIPLDQGWYLTPEWRMGWEPHMRVQVALGRRF